MSFNQLVCLFCGHQRPIKSDFSLKEFHIEPSEFSVITVRSIGPGPGRGHKGERGEGFRTIGRLNLIEALNSDEHGELAESLRQRFLNIVRSYLECGLIEFEELEP